jgi:hypothetical protein
MCATCDDRTILVNVHVGGINRSTDGGRSWQPTIDIDADVHQVCAHPQRAELLVAAAGVGLCVSTDGGASWSKERDGLHAPYCSSVAFSSDDVLVAAASDHFASQGAVYRRSLTAGGALRPMDSGLPRWLEGLPDTACVATRDAHIASAEIGIGRPSSRWRSGPAGGGTPVASSCSIGVTMAAGSDSQVGCRAAAPPRSGSWSGAVSVG